MVLIFEEIYTTKLTDIPREGSIPAYRYTEAPTVEGMGESTANFCPQQINPALPRTLQIF